MPPAVSVSRPPRYVPYASASPLGRSFTTNASGQGTSGGGPPAPARGGGARAARGGRGGAGWRAAGGGGSGERVAPIPYAAPARATAIPPLVSPFDPPRYVPYTSLRPLGLSFATKASVAHGTSETHRVRNESCSALRVGKSRESVLPVTNACPLRSTARPTASSLRLPPR